MPRHRRGVRSGTASEMTSKHRHDPPHGAVDNYMIDLSLAVTNGFMCTPTLGVTKVCPEHPATGLPAPHREPEEPKPASTVPPPSNQTFQL
jgi:hypothetical protein